MSLKFNEKNHPYIDLGDGYRVCFYEERCPHGEEMESKARKAINEGTREEVLAAHDEFRKLIATDQAMCVPINDEWYLNVFLRASRFDPREAFDRLQSTSTAKIKNWEYFGQINDIRHVFDEELVWVLPERDDDGAVIIVVESGKKWNPAKVSLVHLNAAVTSIIGVLMLSEDAQLHGCKLIFDMEGLSMTQIVQFTPKSTGVMLHMLEKCTTIRVLGTHTVNNGMMYNMLFAIMKPLLTKVMRERTLIHGRNYGDLAKHISPRVLPKRYGGTSKAPACEGRLLGDMMVHYNDWMQSKHDHGYKRKNGQAE
uniref:Alpha-tocopherol transfer protein-like n=1 Tax=Culex pipiens TaxID=7175 RepID=A0A8D8AHV9_CULPI